MYKTQKTKESFPYLLIGKLAVITIFMIFLFLFVLFVLPERTAAASNAEGKTYTITSVQIEKGDSLWSLASFYFTDEFSSVEEYITEIKRMNGLSSDVLYAGNYILIPQFIEE